MGQSGGASLTYESIIFFWQNEARIIHKENEYNLNCGIIGAKYLNTTGSVIEFGRKNGWINISKRDLLFLDKTIIQVNEYSMSRVKDKIGYNYGIGILFLQYVFSSPGRWASDEYKERLWNEMISQLIPANPDAVETITRETIKEALFETRLKIHEIKNAPPRMNQLSPLTPRPLTPRPLTPRKLKLVPRVSQLLSVPNQPLRRRTRRNKNTLFGPNKNALFGPTVTI